VSAVIAFRSRDIRRIHIQSVVWAGLRARFAADAAAIVEIDDAVLSCEEGGNRANLHAGRVSAVIAPHDRKQASRIGKAAFFDILDPRAINTDRYFVLGLAGDGACMAPNAFPVVDKEAEIHSQARQNESLTHQVTLS
jgi:hypothetical protein